MTWKRSDITDLAVLCAAAFRDQGEFITDRLRRRYPDCPPKVLYAAIERASKRGLLDYGVSLRSGWVTAEGVRVMGEAFGWDARG